MVKHESNKIVPWVELRESLVEYFSPTLGHLDAFTTRKFFKGEYELVKSYVGRFSKFKMKHCDSYEIDERIAIERFIKGLLGPLQLHVRMS